MGMCVQAEYTPYRYRVYQLLTNVSLGTKIKLRYNSLYEGFFKRKL